MKFTLIPILEKMAQLYSKPISGARFQEYLGMLQGDAKDDLVLPIGGYNPMAQSHVLDKSNELQKLDAEAIMRDTLRSITFSHAQDIQVVLNLADDLKGGWTNRFTTDYESKFKLNALVSRSFCTPFFWSSEVYSEVLIRERTLAYVYRTLYWLNHPKPLTLHDHISQEAWVQKQMNIPAKNVSSELSQFYLKHKDSEAHDIIFNFLYGDEASASLGYRCYGITANAGFKHAQGLAI